MGRKRGGPEIPGEDDPDETLGGADPRKNNKIIAWCIELDRKPSVLQSPTPKDTSVMKTRDGETPSARDTEE
ncbi:hypothetical protein NDU88_004769 [Pleurodeles waltl]|uniref:Uncharacterized protein n=1 Tax=Pleurodeles waltl TaxID=8319 RepID=A0AAV7SJU3_PLEWA|nr:hypothetical protein NDU88_004769 [Pleurodeles waltl]